MQKNSWKITFLHTLVFVALSLFLLGGLGLVFAIAYDDRSMDFFVPMLAFVFWPGLLLPEWESRGFPVLFMGFITTLVLYSGIVTIFVEGVKSIRRK